MPAAPVPVHRPAFLWDPLLPAVTALWPLGVALERRATCHADLTEGSARRRASPVSLDRRETNHARGPHCGTGRLPNLKSGLNIGAPCSAVNGRFPFSFHCMTASLCRMCTWPYDDRGSRQGRSLRPAARTSAPIWRGTVARCSPAVSRRPPLGEARLRPSSLPQSARPVTTALILCRRCRGTELPLPARGPHLPASGGSTDRSGAPAP